MWEEGYTGKMSEGKNKSWMDFPTTFIPFST